MTVAEAIARVRVLLADQEDQEFTDEEILVEMNLANQELNDSMSYYLRTEGLPISEGQVDFELPDDCARLVRMRVDDPKNGPELVVMDEGDVLNQVSAAKEIVAMRTESAGVVSLNLAFEGGDENWVGGPGTWGE